MTTNELEFIKELKELLRKYNAEIYVSMDGDTHGVTSEIIIDIANKEVWRDNNSLTEYNLG